MCRASRAVWIVGGIVLAIILILPLVFGFGFHPWYETWGWGMMGPGMMYGFGGGMWMMIMMVVFWGLIIWGIMVLARHFGRDRHTGYYDNTPLEILKRRYAQGEITREEYEEKKKELS
jgi:putative membrane protein